jgi:hypothetical protein
MLLCVLFPGISRIEPSAWIAACTFGWREGGTSGQSVVRSAGIECTSANTSGATDGSHALPVRAREGSERKYTQSGSTTLERVRARVRERVPHLIQARRTRVSRR